MQIMQTNALVPVLVLVLLLLLLLLLVAAAAATALKQNIGDSARFSISFWIPQMSRFQVRHHWEIKVPRTAGAQEFDRSPGLDHSTTGL